MNEYWCTMTFRGLVWYRLAYEQQWVRGDHPPWQHRHPFDQHRSGLMPATWPDSHSNSPHHNGPQWSIVSERGDVGRVAVLPSISSPQKWSIGLTGRHRLESSHHHEDVCKMIISPILSCWIPTMIACKGIGADLRKNFRRRTSRP